MKLRSHLVVLILVTLIPMLAFAVAGAAWLIQRERLTFERGVVERNRALTTLIDAELAGHIGTLRAIATRESLQTDSVREFQSEAQALLRTQSSWFNLVVLLPTGEQVINALVPDGVALPEDAHPESLHETVTTRQASITPIMVDNMPEQESVALRYPVIRGGEVRYVLSATLRPGAFAALMAQQRLPADWTGSVIDQNDRFVSRTLHPRESLGKLASPVLREARVRARDGWVRGRTLEGRDVYFAYAESRLSGWTVATAVPAATLNAGLRNTALVLMAATGIALLLAVVLALSFARRISRPIAALAAAARDFGRGADVRPAPESRLLEVRELASALSVAGMAVKQREEHQNALVGALRANDRAKNEFLAMLGHELRNPLGALASSAHILRAAGDDARAAEQAKGIMERQIAHMTRLVDDLLEVSRVTSGRVTLARQMLDLGALVEGHVATARASGRLAQHRVSVKTQPVWAYIDEARMEQVIANLLGNALKYTAPGGAIRIEVKQEGDDAVLQVSDEGAGFSVELESRIFDLFVQGERALDRSEGGLGIGLTMVKRLVELHGGTVEAQSAGPGRGACFTVRLPAEAAPQRAIARDAPGDELRRPRQQQTVLVIEDNVDARLALTLAIGLGGDTIYEAGDGPHGIALAKVVHPDIAVIDIGLPGMDGYEVARELKRSSESAYLVALTGYGQPEDVARAKAAGFDAHVTKPVSMESLQRIIAGARRMAGSA